FTTRHPDSTRTTRNKIRKPSDLLLSIPSLCSLFALWFPILERAMLTAEGCRHRRQRLWQRLEPNAEGDHLVLADPIHLMYLANFFVDPFSLGAGFRGYLLLRKDGHAKLLHDNRLPKSVEQAHVEERRVVPWYDGQSPGRGPRQLALLEGVNPEGHGLRV